MYPKGYTEMLEQQQERMVAGLREIFKRAQAGKPWTGKDLPLSHSGVPLTHDILADLDVLTSNSGDANEVKTFEEDPQKMQAQLYAQGAESTQRRGSVSSDSNHSGHHDYVYTPSDTQATPFEAKPNPDDFDWSEPSPRPASQSPAVNQMPMFPHCDPRVLLTPSDPTFYQAQWSLSQQRQTTTGRSDSYATATQLDPSIYNGVDDPEAFGSISHPGINPDLAMILQPHAQQRSGHYAGPVLYHETAADFDFQPYVR